MRDTAHTSMEDPPTKPFYVTNDTESPVCIVLVNGLGDAWDSTYAQSLFRYGRKQGISVVSLHLRSMPEVNGLSIWDDCEDICSMYKTCALDKYTRVCFVGHSSGAQALLIFATQTVLAPEKVVFVLQGAVSDREYEEKTNKSLPKQLEVCRSTTGNIPFAHLYSRIHCCRFIDLFSAGSPEDFFSVGQPTLHLNPHKYSVYFVVGECDEYIVVPLNMHISHLKGIPGTKAVCVLPGNHALQGCEDKFFCLLENALYNRSLPTL
ncbi:hypothetical protein NECID01_1872 [Nematocida sp. AWRm77]|nr:hypothetical protein NECID01_1872 [Nematocida sp. AWRm77]